MDTALLHRADVKIKRGIMTTALGKDPEPQTMNDSSLCPLKRHRDVPGCFREAPVSTVSRVSFTAALFSLPFLGAWRGGTRTTMMEPPCFPSYTYSHLCWTLNLLAFVQRVSFTSNKPSLEILLSSKPREMILSSFPFWAKNYYLCHMRYTRNWQPFPGLFLQPFATHKISSCTWVHLVLKIQTSRDNKCH